MSTVATSPGRLRDDLVGLVHRGADVRDFALGAARILARAVPFEGVCVGVIDPRRPRRPQATAGVRARWITVSHASRDITSRSAPVAARFEA